MRVQPLENNPRKVRRKERQLERKSEERQLRELKSRLALKLSKLRKFQSPPSKGQANVA